MDEYKYDLRNAKLQKKIFTSEITLGNQGGDNTSLGYDAGERCILI